MAQNGGKLRPLNNYRCYSRFHIDCAGTLLLVYMMLSAIKDPYTSYKQQCSRSVRAIFTCSFILQYLIILLASYEDTDQTTHMRMLILALLENI